LFDHLAINGKPFLYYKLARGTYHCLGYNIEAIQIFSKKIAGTLLYLDNLTLNILPDCMFQVSLRPAKRSHLSGVRAALCYFELTNRRPDALTPLG